LSWGLPSIFMGCIVLETAYDIGKLVYLRSDLDIKGYIVGLKVGLNNNFHYLVRCGIDDIVELSEFEITDEKDYAEG
jgi:hypothetical protein